MSYTTDHASAYADVKNAGAAVTFTLASTTVAGYAIRIKGDPKKYHALKLVESEAPTLLFVPTTYGERPPLNALTTFGGTEYAVTDEEPLMPDGTAILSKVVVAR
jgi:hypothetical protein